MNDLKTLLEKVGDRVSPSTEAWEELRAKRSVRNRNRRITAAAIALLVAGAGMTGVVVALGGGGHRQPAGGQVMVPDTDGIKVSDARVILKTLGLRETVRRAPSKEEPAGFVVGQDPHSGRLSAGSTVLLTVSSGPGPGPDSLFYFARGVVIPLTHNGEYTWRSPQRVLPPFASSWGIGSRVVGDASVGNQRILPVTRSAGQGRIRGGIVVTFEVGRLHRPAWLLILTATVGFERPPLRLPRGGFKSCPRLAGTLQPRRNAKKEAERAAVAFVRAYVSGDEAAKRQFEDSSAVGRDQEWDISGSSKGPLLGGSRSVAHLGFVAHDCGATVAARSWATNFSNGSNDASRDFSVFLILRASGWKVWGAS